MVIFKLLSNFEILKNKISVKNTPSIEIRLSKYFWDHNDGDCFKDTFTII